MPSYLGALILKYSKKIMNNFVQEINGFYKNSIYYGDTYSLYIKKNFPMYRTKVVWLDLIYGKVKMIINLEALFTNCASC